MKFKGSVDLVQIYDGMQNYSAELKLVEGGDVILKVDGMPDAVLSYIGPLYIKFAIPCTQKSYPLNYNEGWGTNVEFGIIPKITESKSASIPRKGKTIEETVGELSEDDVRERCIGLANMVERQQGEINKLTMELKEIKDYLKENEEALDK
jgi:hypothetical protein